MSNVHDPQVQDAQQLSKLRNDSLPNQQALPAVVEGLLGSLGSRQFHTFTGDAMQVWRQIALATGPEVLPATEAINRPIKLEHFYVHQVQIAGETPGEYVDAIRVVLIEPEGRAFGFVSDGIAKDLARIISTFGMGPYSPPIPVKAVQFNTRKGRRAYSLQPA